MTKQETTQLMRIKNDTYGNPRYVVHFQHLINDIEDKELFETNKGTGTYVFKAYDLAAKKANKIGGRKYKGKDFGGGIVFQSYNTEDLIKQINKLKGEAK
jgi:hypothetical protein